MTEALLETPLAAETRGFARSASIIALGNVASRVLGLVREMVKARLFGAGAHVDALTLAISVPLQIYELVTGGLVNSALVPVFSEYTPVERRAELWRLASLLLTLAAVGVTLFTGALVAFTPQVVAVFAALGQGRNPEAMALAEPLLRLTLPAVIFLSLSGILSGLLYALQRFTLPAFTAAVFNASMVVVSLLFARQLGVRAMALGLLAGAVLQVLLQWPGLRDARLRPSLNFQHAGLRRIVKLYLPIIGGLLITQISIYLGLGLAGGFVGGLGWMYYATTLYQFPLGLVATAVSLAVLPTLSRQSSEAGDGFVGTLVQGINLVVLLIVPAAVGLFVLARPIVALAFERGEFTALDTAMTAQVLQVFLVGLSFAAVDQMLIFGFYARQDTLTPASVGVLSVVVYASVALLLLRPLGLFSLMAADAVKQITHALVTGALLAGRVGGFRRTTLWPTLAKVVLASAVMAGCAWGALQGVQFLALPANTVGRALLVGVPGAVGVVVYFFLATRLHIAEVHLAVEMIRRRLRV
jgi:putative peptidoglycan lipid II flippase